MVNPRVRNPAFAWNKLLFGICTVVDPPPCRRRALRCSRSALSPTSPHRCKMSLPSLRRRWEPKLLPLRRRTELTKWSSDEARSGSQFANGWSKRWRIAEQASPGETAATYRSTHTTQTRRTAICLGESKRKRHNRADIPSEGASTINLATEHMHKRRKYNECII